MQQSDLEGIARSGAAARAAGGSFHSNPHYASPVQWETVKQLTAWHDIANAWAAGWLMQRQFGCGSEFTYLYPGLRKVAQAAGRVIRSTTDRGVIYLIDDRFKNEAVRALMPRWWTPRMLQESSTSITFAKGSQQSSVSTQSPASWLDNYQ